jgi:ABC-type Fe3+/spermidine/putrescine transport system ATPase subunit/nucleotide-binding universal stress UspA family protein
MSIVLDQLTKHYSGQAIVDRLSLSVSEGEFFVLLGASGSGKSSVLRLIAGLSSPDSGTVRLHGRDVTMLAPQERGVGFVFQNYSIFRHMTVSENIEFGLRIRRVPPAVRRARRDELLDLVGLRGLGQRFENELSGGQRQRVALARALAYEPSVLLLDEPFGALDVKIRLQLRRSLREIQQTLSVTTILVTHDQEEAFELGQRIGVIERGQLLEVGRPEELYTRPRTVPVATFLGSGSVLVGRCRSGRAQLGPVSLTIPPDVPHEEGDRVRVLLRPEHIALSSEEPSQAISLGRGEIVEQSFAGALRRLRVRLPPLPGTRQLAPALPYGEHNLLVESVMPAEAPAPPAQPWVTLRGWHVLAQPTPRLLVCDRGRGKGKALAAAKELAAAFNATTTILGVASRRRRTEKLRAAIDQRRQEQNLTADIQIREGDPKEQILLEEADLRYDFVLLGEPRRLLRSRRFRSTGEVLLQQGVTPLIVVKGESPALRRILICTAAGQQSQGDIRVGGWIARRFAAPVTILFVHVGEGDPASWAQGHLDRGVATLRALEVESTVAVRRADSPLEGILSEIGEGGYDLVVIGGSGQRTRGFFGGGSDISRQILKRSPVSVLAVPEGAW